MSLVYAAWPPTEKKAEERQALMDPYHVVFAQAYRGLDHRPLSLTVFVLAAAYCSLYLPESNMLKELDPRARCDAAIHILQAVEKAPKENLTEAQTKKMTTLRRLGGHVFSDLVLTDGLGALLNAIFAEDKEVNENSRAKARQIAFVLAQKPRLLKKEVYFVALSKQMYGVVASDLYSAEGCKAPPALRTHALSVLVHLVQSLELEYPEYLQFYFTKPMIRPLMMLFATPETLTSDKSVLASADALKVSLDSLHAICTHADTPSHVIMSFIMGNLYSYFFVASSSSPS